MAAETEMNFEENRAFFKKFGARLAKLRKSNDVTQVQMAEALGYSQQQIAAFESGSRRLPLSVVPPLLQALGVSFEELMGIEKQPAKPRKRGPPSKLERQMEELSRLPRNKQRFVTEMLDTVLKQSA